MPHEALDDHTVGVVAAHVVTACAGDAHREIGLTISENDGAGVDVR
jgi:hypothetical protein